jgi:hypothetical protein
MPAASALIEMAAECGGTTVPNGPQDFEMLPADPVAVSFDECSSCSADQIGHLQRWPRHLAGLREFVFPLQQVQRTGGRVEVTLGEMEVDGGLFQIAMA